jgi:hypothetical protein
LREADEEEEEEEGDGAERRHLRLGGGGWSQCDDLTDAFRRRSGRRFVRSGGRWGRTESRSVDRRGGEVQSRLGEEARCGGRSTGGGSSEVQMGRQGLCAEGGVQAVAADFAWVGGDARG